MRFIWSSCAADRPAATKAELREGDVQSSVGCRPRSRCQCSRIECGFVSPWKSAGQSLTFISINSNVAMFAQTMPKRELFQDQLRNHRQSVLEQFQPASSQELYLQAVPTADYSSARHRQRRAKSFIYSAQLLATASAYQLLTTWRCKRPRGCDR